MVAGFICLRDNKSESDQEAERPILDGGHFWSGFVNVCVGGVINPDSQFQLFINQIQLIMWCHFFSPLLLTFSFCLLVVSFLQLKTSYFHVVDFLNAAENKVIKQAGAH